MAYKVLKDFIDLQDKNRLNEKAQAYPREGLDVSEERVAELQDKGFIEAVVEEEKEDEEFPMHKGGGNYVLSNGETVKGKEAAIEAEEQLKAGE